MASPLNPLDDAAIPTIANLNTATSSPSTSTASGASGASSASSGTTNPQTPVAQQASPGQIASLNQTFDFSPLTNYVQGQGTAARNAITGANTNFQSQLGTFNPFGADAQNTLSAVINGSQPLSAGQSLLNQSYTGPAAFDRSSYDPLVSTYTGDVNNLTNPNGIASLLGQVNPGLTPGDRAYDATIFGKNPDFQNQVKSLQGDANTVQGLADTTYNTDSGSISQRQKDIQSNNTAAQGFVQQQQQALQTALNSALGTAQSNGAALSGDISKLSNGSMSINDIPANELGFNPSQYAPQEITSQYGKSVFDQTVNPWQFLTYNAGNQNSLGSVATPDQIKQWNNIEALLNGNNTLQATPGQGPMLNFNDAGWQGALAAANAAMNAADANYAKAHPPATPMPPAVVAEPAVGVPGAQGGINTPYLVPSSAVNAVNNPLYGPNGYQMVPKVDAGGNPIDPNQPFANIEAYALPYISTAGQNGPYNEIVPYPNGPGGGGDYAKGGMIRPQGRSMEPTKAPPVHPQGHPQPLGGVSKLAQMLAQRAPMPFQSGGKVPLDAGIPGVKDSVPANVNAGEFVVRKPSVDVVGKRNLAELNNADHMNPQQQEIMRAALSRALAQGLSKGGLTTAQRDNMPKSEFAGPDHSFPVNDKKHARLAIGGATRSFNAGNISQSEEDSIKAKARKKLA